MTPLQQKILRLVEAHGPLDISQYMQAALADPDHGYYKTAEPFGRDGDFITAPEISQMFGELLAIWVAASWQGMGCPSPFTLCELGPGRGTLMDDVLRTLGKLVPQCRSSARILMVETSPRLAAMQQERLRPHGLEITWVENFSQIPPLPLVLLANELFDALPIHQYVAKGGVLHERMIAADDGGNLFFSSGLPLAGAPSAPEADRLADGTVVEISPARTALAGEISAHIARHRGAALIIDYGALQPGTGDTLQAMAKHGYRNPLENPGQYDLTSHVDFAALMRAAHTASCHSAAMTQGDFLLQLGLLERAGRLGAGKDETFRQQIMADAGRLAGPGQMGALFKALCIADTGTTMPPFSWETS